MKPSGFSNTVAATRCTPLEDAGTYRKRTEVAQAMFGLSGSMIDPIREYQMDCGKISAPKSKRVKGVGVVQAGSINGSPSVA